MNFLKMGAKPVPSQATATDQTKIVGHADIFADGRIKGWALDLDDPDGTLWIDVFTSAGFLRSFDANLVRPDLENLYFRQTRHGFDIDCELSPGEMAGVYLIARRKDRSGRRATPNITTQFVQDAHAGHPVMDSALSPANAAPVASRAASATGTPDVSAVLRAALGTPPVTILTAREDGPSPVVAVPGAAPVNVPADSKIILSKTKRLEGGQSCIVVDHLLQHGVDYRSILGAAFEKLKVGGFLIVVVPSQILYERKLQLPSRLPTRFGKFYTPSILVAELEEAIDPFTFRVRHVGDLDANYVAGDLDEHPEGQSDLMAVIEKTAEPAWLGRLKTEDAPVAFSDRPTDRLKPGRTSPYIIVKPDPGEVKSILILQLDHRGDYVMGVDARELIRSIWPDAKVTLVCGSWNQQDAMASGTIDEVIAFNFFSEDSSTRAELLSFSDRADILAKLVKGRSFDLAMDLRLNTDTRELLMHVDARFKAGFDSCDEFPWLDIRMPTIDPDLAAKVWQRFVRAADLHTCGEHNFLNIKVSPDDCIQRDGGTIIWGPYLDLPAGRYEVKLVCDCALRTELSFDVCSNEGREVIGAGTVKVGPFVNDSIQLWLPHDAKGLELRVYALPGRPYPPLSFGGLHIIRRASMIGLHRTENMNLLVHLIAMRMRYATRTERMMEHAAE